VILVATMLWAAAWFAIARRLRRRARLGGANWALSTLVVAAILGATGGYLDERCSSRLLAVARHDAPLRILPALDADRTAVLRLGETVRVVGREGPWARVRVDGDRDGWVPDDGLLPLDRD
jgi:uncharacterized protein YgiM (DUF1202 family)